MDYKKMWQELRGYILDGIKEYEDEISNNSKFNLSSLLCSLNAYEKMKEKMQSIEKEAKNET